MPICCNSLHVGWVCPKCGERMTVKPHSGNDPVPIGKIAPPNVKQQVTVVQGDYIQGSVIKDSVVMGDVPQGDDNNEVIAQDSDDRSFQGSVITDSIVMGDTNQKSLTNDIPVEKIVDTSFIDDLI